MIKNFCIAAFLSFISCNVQAQDSVFPIPAEAEIIQAGHQDSSIFPPEAAVIYGVHHKKENSLRSNNQIPQPGGKENHTLTEEFSASESLLEKQAARYLLRAQKIEISLNISTLVYPFHEFL